MNRPQSSFRPNSRNLIDHPYYFGIFLNMARHNAFMIIKHLSAKYDTEDKDKLDESLLEQAKLFAFLRKRCKMRDVTQAVIRDLRSHFPFLNYEFFLREEMKQREFEKPSGERNFQSLPETDPERILDILQNSFMLINKLRNNFSHYISEGSIDRLNSIPIREIYEAAIFRLVDKGKTTKRFNVFEKEHVQHLLEQNGVASDYMPKDAEQNTISEKTLVFLTCLFLERKYAFPLLSRLEGFQNTTNQEPTMAMKATVECYTMFCCRLPQPKLESSDIMLDMLNELGRCPSALYTVLSEENKQRFHVESEGNDLENEEELSAELSEKETQAFAEEEDLQLNNVTQEVVLKRHDDRFPYFALRYFDDTNAFPTLRFQVQLGKLLRQPVYEKKISGELRERKLVKPIMTFCKLKEMLLLYEAVDQNTSGEKWVNDEFVSRFPPTWLTTSPDNGKKRLRSEIEQFSPHYNSEEQVIGFRFIDLQRGSGIPNFRASQENGISKFRMSPTDSPDAVISTYELRSLFLYHYLYKTRISPDSEETFIKIDPETFIKDYIKRIQQFFKDVKDGVLEPLAAPPDYEKNKPVPFVKDNPKKARKLQREYNDLQKSRDDRKVELDKLLQSKYGITTANIPGELLEYLLAYKIPSYKHRAEAKFDAQLKVVKERIKDNEKGRSPRVGEQATWLAEDIIFLMPPREHTAANGEIHLQKLNNDQFRVLQSSLAFFSTSKPEILKLLKEETTILSNVEAERHPFLDKVNLNGCSGIFDFYQAYLLAKKGWLKEILSPENMENTEEEEFKKRYSNFLPLPIEDKRATDRNYLSQSVLLPRGLFNKAIAEALSGKAGIKVTPDDNIIHCMAQYLGGDLQSFYELPHFYRSILTPKDAENKLVGEAEYKDALDKKLLELKALKQNSRKLNDEEKQQLKNEYRDVRGAKTRLLDREQYLRFLQTNDRALWLMIKDRQSSGALAEHTEIDFNALKLRNIETVLNTPVSVKLRIPNSEVYITDHLPLKRYGDLRRIAKDRRLENLAKYYELAGQTNVEHEVIKKELERYDARRETFFKLIYNFEKEVYQQFSVEFDNNTLAKDGFFSHYVYVNVATGHSSDTPLNLFIKSHVSELRNKFHHNEFPFFDWLKNEVDAEEGGYYADKVFNIAEHYYNRLLRQIKPNHSLT